MQTITSKPMVLFDPKIQLLANYLSSGTSRELSPVPDLQFGVRYPEAERITGDDPVTVKKWLEELVSDGILETKFEGKLLICLKCGSSDTPVHYCCPFCKSIDIEKKALFEHLACGVIDKDDNFGKPGQQVCPRCSRRLDEMGITHRTVGTWFLCRSCQKSFSRTQSFHICNKCKNFFIMEDAELQDIHAYRLCKDAEAELKSGGMFLKPLKDLMEDLGYAVTVAGNLHGASGTVHIFDLVGVKQGEDQKETLAVDVVASDRFVEESSVTAYFLKEAYWHLFAKRYETNPDRTVLVAIPAIHETGRKLAALYKVTLIEAGSALEAVEKLRADLSS